MVNVFLKKKQLKIVKKKNELEENKVCILNINSNLNIDNQNKLFTRLDRCLNLKSNKCDVFLKKFVNNLSICSIAKKYKSFELIKNFSIKDYYSSLNICENDNFKKIKKSMYTRIRKV